MIEKTTLLPGKPAIPEQEAVPPAVAWIEFVGDELDSIESSDEWQATYCLCIGMHDKSIPEELRFGERLELVGEDLERYWGHPSDDRTHRYSTLSSRHPSRSEARVMALRAIKAELQRLIAAVESRKQQASQAEPMLPPL